MQRVPTALTGAPSTGETRKEGGTLFTPRQNFDAKPQMTIYTISIVLGSAMLLSGVRSDAGRCASSYVAGTRAGVIAPCGYTENSN